MINFILFIIFISCIGLVAAWLAENPGQVTMTWFDYQIDTSLAFLLCAAFVFAFSMMYLILLVRWLVLAPSRLRRHRSERRYRKGLGEITYSVAALAASDIANAQAHTKKAQKLLGTTPLTLLLQAQIARSNGDEEKTHELLQKMLEHKETEYLAARSLSDNASKQQQLPKALGLAQRAQKMNPRDANSAQAVISLHRRLHQWQEALSAIDMAARKGRWHRNKAQRARALVHIAQGGDMLAAGETGSALLHARMALRLLPAFVPGVVFAAKCYSATGQTHKGSKLIIQCWKHSPHPALAEQFRILMVREPKEKQIAWIKKLAAKNPSHLQSQLAVAETAIKFQAWDIARTALKIALAKEETVLGCKLMAYLEQGEFSDFDAAGRWLAKSGEAITDPSWHCAACSHNTEQWDAHCPSCHGYDSLEWKSVNLKFVG